jgi:hypothetical protein
VVRPPDDVVRREWDAVIGEARMRWHTMRDRVDRMRKNDPPAGDRLPEP